MEKDKPLTIGSILTAGLASICCIGPIVAVALGAGAFGAAAALESWRPYLLALTALMLGIAFYRAYRPRNKEECACAGTAGTNRKRLVWIVTAIVIPLAGFPYYSNYVWGLVAAADGPAVAAAKTTEKTVRLVLEVEGMTCEGCARSIESALRREPGIVTAKVDYPSKTAYIEYRPEKTSPEKISEVIRSLGYEPKPSSDKRKETGQ